MKENVKHALRNAKILKHNTIELVTVQLEQSQFEEARLTCSVVEGMHEIITSIERDLK